MEPQMLHVRDLVVALRYIQVGVAPGTGKGHEHLYVLRGIIVRSQFEEEGHTYVRFADDSTNQESLN